MGCCASSDAANLENSGYSPLPGDPNRKALLSDRAAEPMAHDVEGRMSRASFQSADTVDLDHQSVRMIAVANFCLASSGKYVWQDSARSGMGRRSSKIFFLVNSGESENSSSPSRAARKAAARQKLIKKNEAADKYAAAILQIPLICPFTFHSEAEKKAFKQLILNLKHPYIAPVLDVGFGVVASNSIDLIVVRKFYPKGSLRDEIYGVDEPQASYSSKYPKAKKGTPLTAEKIRNYGRQILEAMVVLRKKGITCYNLSTSNVLIGYDEATKSPVAQISDIENSILCRPPPSSLDNLTLVHEQNVDVDVLHFGHMLFEMALGHRLTKSSPCQALLDSKYDGVNKEVVEVLALIFSCKPCSENADQNAARRTSIEDVMSMPLFCDVPVKETCSVIKLNHAAKKVIKVCMASIANCRSHRLAQFEASLSAGSRSSIPPLLVHVSSSSI
eukprot:CAMPEP_0182478434 /NCGR_PEP_ID=MMETSP1319-20130603/32492_1 /TAXON_ID=172717 /ORGANISM="Bolidomonas pacifica, Strain RCC208" /LENGTH=445 /DNA_ID=CAMNT_0024679773 /DNA_START=95 /DNA_END=1429 /DNA_ORIENTATION=-